MMNRGRNCVHKRGECKPPFLAASGPLRYVALLQARWPCEKPGQSCTGEGARKWKGILLLAPGRRRSSTPNPPNPLRDKGLGGLLPPFHLLRSTSPWESRTSKNPRHPSTNPVPAAGVGA
jgi:hypothetical protein